MSGMMTLQNNLMAMGAYRHLGITTDNRAKSTKKLSSGYKINTAADDAAGLSISEKMRRQIRGLNQGIDNIQDGISCCQIMDGALSEVQDILQRMNELSIHAANGTLTDDDRGDIEAEVKQLKAEIDRTTETTNFNTIPLLRGKPVEIIFLVDNTGSMGGMINKVKNNLQAFTSHLADSDVTYGLVEYGDLNEVPNVIHAMTPSSQEMVEALDNIELTGGGDGPESALDAIADAMNPENFPIQTGATRHLILVTDADYHYAGASGHDHNSSWSEQEIVDLLDKMGTTLSVVTQPHLKEHYEEKLKATHVLDITGDFSSDLGKIADDFSIKIENIPIKMSGDSGDWADVHKYHITSDSLGLGKFSCKTQQNADAGIELVKKALKKISGVRSQIGAEQNMLEHASAIRRNVVENTTAAESRIRDTDIAEEMLQFSLQGILEQAGTSMLAQANQMPQNILSLIQ